MEMIASVTETIVSVLETTRSEPATIASAPDTIVSGLETPGSGTETIGSVSETRGEEHWGRNGPDCRGTETIVETFPTPEWHTPEDFKILNNRAKATPRKIVTHILLHEIRHWAQIATVFRLNGVVEEFYDFLGSPVMG